MAKATPEELAMHESAKGDADSLEKVIETGAAPLTDNTPNGDANEMGHEPPRRKRGRPSNAEKALEENLKRETVGESQPASGPASKPGRKASPKASTDPGLLGQQLVGLHQLGAMLTGIPELAINETEGAALGKAIVAVCDQYSLSVDGKTGAALQLLAAAAMIYAPRAFHYKMRVAQSSAQQEAQPQGVQINGVEYPPAAN